MRLLFVSFLSFIIINASAQDTSSVYAEMITAKELKKHLEIIASDEMEGRETGTEGERKAAAYMTQFFKKAGLSNAPGIKNYQHPFQLFTDVSTKSTLEINDSEAVWGKDFIIPAGTNKTGKFETEQLVFAGYGIEDKNYNDYLNLSVKGKTVVIFLGEPKDSNIFRISGTDKPSDWTYPGLAKKIMLAAQKGASGVLVISPSTIEFSERATASSKKTGLYFKNETATDYPLNYAILSHEFAKTILPADMLSIGKKSQAFTSEFLKEIKMEVELDYREKQEVIRSANVVAAIEGSDKKDEFVFLTAHYDHLGVRDGKIYNGADDDGSGTVAIMKAGEVFAKAKADGNGPRRTVVIMAFSGEEKGLLGSEFYSENPLYPLEKTSVDLNIDMIGRIDTERMSSDSSNYVYVVGHDKLSTDLQKINESVNNQYSQLVLDYKFDDPKDPHRIYFRSDHYNFARKGVPVLFFYDGMLKSDYHKPTDTVEKINWQLYEKRARMIFHTAWEMANRDEMLKRDLELPSGKR